VSAAAQDVTVVVVVVLLLIQDMPLLGLHPNRVTYASDHFQGMIETATRLIRTGFLYADDTPVEEVRSEPEGVMERC
jgi:glutamyl-tRNA synthetase